MDIGLSLHVDENVMIFVRPCCMYTPRGRTDFPASLLELGKEMEEWLQATLGDVTLSALPGPNDSLQCSQ